MKILLITPEYPPDYGGGISSYYEALVPALREKGCAVDVLRGCAFVHGGPDYVQDGVRVSSLAEPGFRKWAEKLASFEMFPELHRHLAAAFALHEQAAAGEGYDVVQTTDWGLLFVPWAAGARAKVVVDLHGSAGQIASHEPVAGRDVEGMLALLIEKEALAGGVVATASSRANAHWWQECTGTSVRHAWPPFRMPEVAGSVAAPRERWITGARVQFWKGPHVACEAWKLLGSEAPALEWIGRDTWEGKTGISTDASLAARYPGIWRGKIVPLGALPSRKFLERLAAARAVLVPSTWDVFNRVAVEAMALGKAVVVSDGAGSAGLVRHGENGFVFRSGDVADLAAAVRRVERLSQKELGAIGEAARETVRRQCDPGRVAEGLLSLYREPGAATKRRPDAAFALGASGDGYRHLSFLDVLPLRDLAQYILRRAGKKVLGRG